MRFASRGPGVEFMKMMILQGLHVIHTHAEKIADEIRSMIGRRANEVDQFLLEVNYNGNK